jgi:hypothetical protein
VSGHSATKFKQRRESSAASATQSSDPRFLN